MNREIFIIVDQSMHSYEAICGVYDSFDKAMVANIWEERGETPDETGYGEDLFIIKYKVE